jgi:hypothetical protein
METSDTSKKNVHYILTDVDPNNVAEAISISQSHASINKIYLIVPNRCPYDFDLIRQTNRKIVDIRKITADGIAESAIEIFKIIRRKRSGEEANPGNKWNEGEEEGVEEDDATIIINITDASVQGFTIAGCILGSLLKCKVISSSLNSAAIEVPLVPYCKLLESRREILFSLGTEGADDVEKLSDKIKDKYPDKPRPHKSNLSPHLKKLEERGFIVRGKDSTSRSIKRTKFGELFLLAYDDKNRSG